MAWQLSLTRDDDRRREVLKVIALSAAVLLPVVILGDWLLRVAAQERTIAFRRQAEGLLGEMVTKLEAVEQGLEQLANAVARAPYDPAWSHPWTTKYRFIETIGFAELFPGGDASHPVLRIQPKPLAALVRLDRSSVQRAAADRARDSGTNIASSKEEDRLFIFRPVYRSGLPVRDVRERRSALRGWTIAVMRPDRLFDSSSQWARTTRAELFDGLPAPSSLLAGSHPGEPVITAKTKPTSWYSTIIDAYGREWHLQIWPRRRLELAFRTSVMVFAIAAFLVALLVWAAVVARRRSLNVSTRMLESFADLIAVIDGEGKIVYLAPSAAVHFARPLHELTGTPFFELVHPEDRASELPDRFHSLRVAGESGQWRELEGSTQHITIGRRASGTLVIARDVTDLRQLQRQVERSERIESLGQIAAKVAHEFNNVLMSIQAQVEVLGRTNPHDTKLATRCGVIKTSLSRGANIAAQVLRFATPRAVSSERFEIEEWLRKIERELRPLLPSRVSLEVELPPERLCICGDSTQLSQVLVNLILNARDALQGKGTIRCAAALSDGGGFPFGVVPAGHFAHLLVHDDGAGMPPAVLNRIFEPLFTTKPKGTGLGLAVSHQIVTAHHGFVFAESEEGRGTDIHLFIPAEAAAS